MFSLQPYRDVFTGGPENDTRTQGAAPNATHTLNEKPQPIA